MHRTRTTPLTFLLALTSACPLLLALLVAFTSSTARADDDKSYPATSCRKVQGSGGTTGTRPTGAVRNDSTSTALTLICPIVRDNTQTTGGWTVDVRVDDRTNSGLVSCTATSRSMTGALAAMPQTSGTSNAFVDFKTLKLSPAAQSTEGYSTLTCTVPPIGSSGGSGIISYVVRESGDDPAGTDQKSYSGTYAEILLVGVGTFPFIQYDDLGRARPINAAANDDWIQPMIRDSTQTWWNRARFRFNDSNGAKALDCSIANYNEDGSPVGFVSFADQDVAPGDATVTVNQNPLNPLYSGPMAMRCNEIDIDATASMYDMREEL